MNRFRMRTSLAATTLVALVAVIASSAVGWSSLGSLTDQSDAGEDTAMLNTALAISHHSSSLALVGLVETNIRMTRASVLKLRSDIASAKADLSTQLAALTGKGYDERASNIENHVNSLITIVDEVDSKRPALLLNIANGEGQRRELSRQMTRELAPMLGSGIDNQLYYMMTGRSDVRGTPGGANAFSREEFARYHHMMVLRRAVAVAHPMLAAAVRASDPTLLTNVEEAFDSAAQQLRASLEFLSVNGGPEFDQAAIPLIMGLIDAGSGPANYFDQVKARLGMVLDERRLITSSNDVLSAIDSEIAALVADVNANIVSSSNESEQAAENGRTTVLVVGIIGIVLILLVAGYLGTRKRPE